jgi:hypothetical protein
MKIKIIEKIRVGFGKFRKIFGKFRKKSFQIGPSKREDAFFGLLEKLWMQCGRSGGAMQR